MCQHTCTQLTASSQLTGEAGGGGVVWRGGSARCHLQPVQPQHCCMPAGGGGPLLLPREGAPHLACGAGHVHPQPPPAQHQQRLLSPDHPAAAAGSLLHGCMVLQCCMLYPQAAAEGLVLQCCTSRRRHERMFCPGVEAGDFCAACLLLQQLIVCCCSKCTAFKAQVVTSVQTCLHGCSVQVML